MTAQQGVTAYFVPSNRQSAAAARPRPRVSAGAIVLVLSACLLAAAADAAEAKPRQRKPQPIKILDSWKGTMTDAARKELAPAEGFVVEGERWAKLWKAWRGREELPEIDFDKQMILVFTAEGPNNVGCEPTLDAQGNVQALAMSTLIGGPGFGYLILCIPREGVRSVNGIPLPGEKLPPRRPGTQRPPRVPGAVPGAPGSSAPGASGSSDAMPSEFGPDAPVESPPSSGTRPRKPPEDVAGGVVSSPLPPVVELDSPRPNRAAWEGATWKKPLVLKSEKDAADHFSGDELAKLTKQVDFGKQVVVIFVWRGSGQDRIDAVVAESYPEQVFFTYKPGRTRDLREHVRAFALRSNVTWSVRD